MAFTAKILSWYFRHLNIVDCLVKRRPTKGGGGSRAPQDPPSYAPDARRLFLTTSSSAKNKIYDLSPGARKIRKIVIFCGRKGPFPLTR